MIWLGIKQSGHQMRLEVARLRIPRTAVPFTEQAKSGFEIRVHLVENVFYGSLHITVDLG